MKKVLFLLLIALSVINHSKSNEYYNLIQDNKLASIMIGVSTIYAGYSIYSKILEYFYNKKVTFIAQNIITALRTNYFNANNEQVMREKAKLINRRIRVMKKLDEKIRQISNSTEKNKYKLDIINPIEVLKKAFGAIDFMRNSFACIQNRYEKEYAQPTTIDNLIENQIVNSILLSLKKDEFCTSAEKNQKKKSSQLRRDVFNKLNQIITTSNDITLIGLQMLLQKIKENDFILDLFNAH